MQNDFNVANGTGAEVRAEINQQIQALASNNSGAGEPPVLFEGMTWYDTTNKVTYRRNATGGWDKMMSEGDAIAYAIALG